LLWGARVFLLSAMAGASYLAAMSLSGGEVAGCGGSAGCNQVLGSRWAYWLGVPVSVPALGAYLSLFLLTWKWEPRAPGRSQHIFWLAGVILSVLVLGAACWFVMLQYFVIGSWCKFCLATHASASLAAVMLLVSTPLQKPGPAAPDDAALSRREFACTAALAAGLGLVELVAGQVGVRKQLYKLSAGGSAGSGRLMVLHGGKFKLDPAELPRLGSDSATNYLVSLFDYTCVHCRAMHPLVKSLEEKYAGRLSSRQFAPRCGRIFPRLPPL
jgi:uncharacterized membrane protein